MNMLPYFLLGLFWIAIYKYVCVCVCEYVIEKSQMRSAGNKRRGCLLISNLGINEKANREPYDKSCTVSHSVLSHPRTWLSVWRACIRPSNFAIRCSRTLAERIRSSIRSIEEQRCTSICIWEWPLHLEIDRMLNVKERHAPYRAPLCRRHWGIAGASEWSCRGRSRSKRPGRWRTGRLLWP